MAKTPRVVWMRLLLLFLLWIPTKSLSVASSRLLIIGYGRVGAEVARQVHGPSISATVRQPPLETPTDGVKRVLFDQSTLAPLIRQCSHVLLTLPAPLDDETWSVMEAMADRFVGEWLGIISTTGVYGDHKGEWVNEDAECRCDPDTSAGRFLTFERYWRERVSPVVVFRCAGIYGGGQSALHTVYRSGWSPKSRQSPPTNRIHVKDLATAVVASMALPPPASSRIYNLADDLPASREEVLEYAVELLRERGIQVPPVAERRASDRTRRRGRESKLIDNRRMREELLPELKYPSYREGLKAILDDPTTPWNVP